MLYTPTDLVAWGVAAGSVQLQAQRAPRAARVPHPGAADAVARDGGAEGRLCMGKGMHPCQPLRLGSCVCLAPCQALPLIRCLANHPARVPAGLPRQVLLPAHGNHEQARLRRHSVALAHQAGEATGTGHGASRMTGVVGGARGSTAQPCFAQQGVTAPPPPDAADGAGPDGVRRRR